MILILPIPDELPLILHEWSKNEINDFLSL